MVCARVNKPSIYFLTVTIGLIYSSAIANAQFGGFGGRGGGRHNQNQQQQQQQKPDTKPEPAAPSDDPLVHESTPPPTEAKLITKVGWCEVQVFGHTFSVQGLVDASLPVQHMHLPARLDQLNHKLNFEPKKSGIQLMDDIDALVRFVFANKHSAAPAGPSPQTQATPDK